MGISNVKFMTDENGKEIAVAATMSEVVEAIQTETSGWPRRVDSALFVDDGGELAWLDRPPAVFGWFARKCGLVDWRRITGAVSKEETFAELQRTAPAYKAIETLPHEPAIAGHYYACPFPEPGDGTTVAELLGFFEVETDLDCELLLAVLATPLWGGPPGTRPAGLITAAGGRGKGKSKLAQAIGRVYGGHLDISANEDIGTVKARLLTREAEARRVATLDNVKAMRFCWAELEALITCDVISGKRMYYGDATRPNYLTWLITLNGAALSTDMAQRVVEIRLGEPHYNPAWEESVAAFIDSNRQAILADLIGFLRRPAATMARHSRWATWEAGVLAKVAHPDACLDLILQRRGAADVEEEEGEIIEGHFATRLRRLNYDPERADVFIPTELAARWFNEATGENRKTVGVTRTLKQLRDEGRLSRIVPTRAGTDGSRGFRWIGEHADSGEPTRHDLLRRLAEGVDVTVQEGNEQAMTDDF
jgi:hypothetical protein